MGKRAIFFAAAFFIAIFIAIIVAAPSSACETACPLQHSSPWYKLVEKSFGLPKGLGAVLMTPEEWEEEKKIMVEMTPRQRQLYKNSVHRRLVEKAEELGIALSGAGAVRKVKKERESVRPFVYASKQSAPVTE